MNSTNNNNNNKGRLSLLFTVIIIHKLFILLLLYCTELPGGRLEDYDAQARGPLPLHPGAEKYDPIHYYFIIPIL